jgi:pyruvate/2-oxoglutarate dehydrogenase complex dihydrolipoamide acyltransferase (E2) component
MDRPATGLGGFKKRQVSVSVFLQTINGLGKKARDGTISIDEMAGGTFTISNGGVYGSLLSTPIINPPQSAILGMHSINQRPMVSLCLALLQLFIIPYALCNTCSSSIIRSHSVMV